jgi:hypothetical protein
MSDYDTDVVTWSEHQADLLSRPGADCGIDVARQYREALHRVPEMIDGVPQLPVPQACPVTLDELLALPPEAA